MCVALVDVLCIFNKCQVSIHTFLAEHEVELRPKTVFKFQILQICQFVGYIYTNSRELSLVGVDGGCLFTQITVFRLN